MYESGDPVRDIHCPKCGFESVLYSGNYFCGNEDCDWAMSENDKGKKAATNRKITRTYLLQRYTDAFAAGRAEEAERMAHYLISE